MPENFGVRLHEQIRERGPLCVGIDPSTVLLESWGRNDDVESLEYFSLAVLEAVLDTAAVLKPQVAFYERFGSRGLRVLERVMGDARDAQVMVIADAKRGDVASTNVGYAQAWLHDESPLRSDALTASPYLGIASLAPLFEQAESSGRGVFVLTATSNEEGRIIQSARTRDNETVEVAVLGALRERNRNYASLGPVGAVLGATRDRPSFDLTTLQGPYLVPGVGAQGASPEDVARIFDRCTPGTVLPSVSRAILQAGPDRSAMRDAARRWRDDLSHVLT